MILGSKKTQTMTRIHGIYKTTAERHNSRSLGSISNQLIMSMYNTILLRMPDASSSHHIRTKGIFNAVVMATSLIFTSIVLVE